jgi:dihydroorotase
MREKLRLGTPVVLLLAFGESFCAAMDGPIVQKDPKIRIILIHITDTRRADFIISIVRDFAVPSRGWSGAV